MSTTIPTVAEITSKAISLLCQQIGSANTARFLHQFSMGTGDYTAELDLGDPTVNDLVQQIKPYDPRRIDRKV